MSTTPASKDLTHYIIETYKTSEVTIGELISSITLSEMQKVNKDLTAEDINESIEQVYFQIEEDLTLRFNVADQNIVSQHIPKEKCLFGDNSILIKI